MKAARAPGMPATHTRAPRPAQLRLLGFAPDVCDLAGYYAKWNLFWPIPNGIYQCMCATSY